MFRRMLRNYSNENSLPSRIRQRRLAAIRNLIISISKYSPVTIADIGEAAHYWRLVGHDFLRRHGATVTLINSDDSITVDEAHDIFRVAPGDGRALVGIADQEFALGLSNSVIEHVGDWQNITRFAHEIRRIAKSYYVQTPNFWFPIEPHYVAPIVHWLPADIRALMLRCHLLELDGLPPMLKSAGERVRSIHLLRQRQMRQLFPDAQHTIEWFLGLPKSLIANPGFPLMPFTPELPQWES